MELGAGTARPRGADPFVKPVSCKQLGLSAEQAHPAGQEMTGEGPLGSIVSHKSIFIYLSLLETQLINTQHAIESSD